MKIMYLFITGISSIIYSQEFWKESNWPNGITDLSSAINSNGYIYAVTNNYGVYRSTNNRDDWVTLNNGLSELYVYSLAINLEGYIYAGTGNGVYCNINSTVTEVEEDKLLSYTFNLDQNCPNPFNPVTTIKYSLPNEVSSEKPAPTLAGSIESLVVYDVLGRGTATLVIEKQNPGNYEVECEASSFASADGLRIAEMINVSYTFLCTSLNQ